MCFGTGACLGPLKPDQSTINSSGGSHMQIPPLYDRVVVRRIEQKETMQGGLYIPDSAKEKPQEGEVVAIGKGKRLEDGKLVPLDVQVGDRILYGTYAVCDVQVDGDAVLIL